MLDVLDPLKHNIFMNRLDSGARAAVISALVEGCSIRSTVRMTGVSKPTVLKLLLEAGDVAADFQDRVFRNLSCKRIQVDELWAFIGAKQKNVTPEIAAKNPHAGDVWLWCAIDADTKIVPCWLVGDRNWNTAQTFMEDLKGRLANRVQLTSDGLKWYFHAVSLHFEGNVDFAMLRKIYRGVVDESGGNIRFSPAKCVGVKRRIVYGDPDPAHISTSFAERQNLSVRTSIRRYTRLTNAFSRKIENHTAAVALYYFSYNFVQIHRTLRTTPAMAAGVVDRLYEVSDLVAMLEAKERSAERQAA